MNLLLRIGIFLTMCIAVCSISEAQKIASPLVPQVEPLRKEYGFFIGVGNNSQTGEYYVECPECVFQGSQGLGFTLGGLYQKEMFRDFWLGGAVAYENQSITGRFREREVVPATLKSTSEQVNLPVWFRHEANALFSGISITPYARYTPFEFMFIRAGISLSYLFYANIRHTSQILDRQILLETGDTATVNWADNNGNPVTSDTKTLEDKTFPDMNRLQFLVPLSLGFTFQMSGDVYLSPVLTYYLPLTEISTFGSNFKINQWKFLMELRVNIPTRIVDYKDVGTL